MLRLLSPTDTFPPLSEALRSPNGLVAAGGALTVDWLIRAYSQGIFPWYCEGDPILWWSPSPRMVLAVENFRMHKSLLKRIRQWTQRQDISLTIDTDFATIIQQCAAPRGETEGTWILPEIIQAYIALHQAGYAHSFEVRCNTDLIGGLYGVSIGRMFYGESMFCRQTDASKVALAGLVHVLKQWGCPLIDCQQKTKHLASLGATPITREEFISQLKKLIQQPSPDWSKTVGKNLLTELTQSIV